MDRIEKLQKKIADGKLAKGVFITLPDAISSEMAGYCGYDYVWIDAEHGPMDRQEILRHIMAAQGAGCCAFVRIHVIEPSIIKSVLDMGPDGIIFPFCNTAEQARLAVASCSYPDDDYHGMRGQGPIRAIRYGLDAEPEYLKKAYGKVWKIMQIETLEGYENLDAIMKVPGIGSMFLGAADLSRSIAGSSKKYELSKVYDDICARVSKAGLPLGAATGATAADAKTAKSKGIGWIVFGQDSRVLASGLKANLDAVGDL